MKKLTSTLLLSFLSIVLIAQNTLTGIVIDQNNKKVIGAEIKVKSEKGKTIADYITSFDGKFKFEGISEDKITVLINAKGFEQLSKKVDFTKNTTQEITFTLKKEIVIREIEAEEKVEEMNISYDMAAPSKKMYKSGAIMSPNLGYANYNTPDFNTESYANIETNAYKSVNKEPLSTLSIDVDRASYSNVRRFITDGEMPPLDAVRIEEMINYFSYDYATPDYNSKDPLKVTTTYTSCPWNEDHQLIHIGLKSKAIDMEEAPANNLVFLLDVSGSMNNADKLPLLKKGLALLVDEMRPEDKISIVVYAGAAGVVLEPTNGTQKDLILESLEKLSAGGSTAGGAGIKLAYKLAKENFAKEGNNRIILATDGDFNIGASSDGEMVKLIEEKRNDGIFLTVLGFGTGNIKDSKMESLADHGNGNYAYIDNILEAKKTLVTEMGGTLITVAKDVKFQLEFNPAYVKEYRLIGYENRMLNAEDFNDDKKDAGELGAGHCVTAIYEIIPAGSEETNANIDDLKYQTEHSSIGTKNGELLTVKVRYKQPDGDQSTKMEYPVRAELIPFERTSNDIRFSAAVASYGMLLRNTEFKGNSSYEMVTKIAKSAKGIDDEGYRAAFIQMVEMTALLDKRDS